jgi:hypothetical protein
MRVPRVLTTVANQIDYELSYDILVPDTFKICRTPTRLGSVTTWTLDTEADKTGHFDAAINSDAGADSIVQIGNNTYTISSVTGDGTDADSVTLNYAAPSGEVVYISSTSANYAGKQQYPLKPGSHQEIYYYPATSNRSIPEKYHLESFNTDDSGNYVREILIGNPTADDTYLVEYYGFVDLADVATATLDDINLISYMGGDYMLYEWGLHFFYKSIKEHALAAAQVIKRNPATGEAGPAIRALADFQFHHKCRGVSDLAA